MKVPLTGGSGFIGANFILDRCAQSDDPVINLEKLTYASELKNQARLQGKPAESIEIGIRKTVQWYLDNPDWVANVQGGAYREWVAKQYTKVTA